MSRRPTARPRPFPLRQIAQACACTVVAGSALAQTTTLEPVRVKAAAESADTLPAAAPGGKTATGARLGVLGNTSVMDAPFSLTPYTAEAIADAQAQTIGAVLRGDPSVRTMTNTGHIVENLAIRGFPVSSSSLAINGMYGLAPEQNTPTEMFERVEVLKGPGAMMMGLPPAGDVGGVVNLVPKRAGADALTRVTGSFYGKSNVTAHADFARRLGEEQRLGVRVNAVMGNGETWLDEQRRNRQLGHLALDYRGNGWTAELDAYTVTNKTRKGSPMQPILTGWTTVPAAPDGSTNFFYGEDVFGNTRTQGVIGRGTYAIDDRWSAWVALGRAEHSYEGFIFGTRPNFPAANAATGTATGTAYHSVGESRTETGELGLRGHFATGGVTHKLAASLSTLHHDSGSRANGTANFTSNLYRPVPIPMPAAAPASTFKGNSDDTLDAISVADTLGFAEDRVQVTLGLRHQRVKQQIAGYEEAALTPLVGVVARPWGESVALYGNYVEGLSPGAKAGPTYTNANETFEPYRSKQAELGVKWQSGALLNTFSLFQITKPALIVVGTEQKPDGEQRNRGLEWTVSGPVVQGVTLLGGAAYTKAEQTKTQAGVNQGNSAFGVPEFTANVAADWSVPWVAGLVLTGQVNHTGSQYLSGNNQAEVPAWTTVDLGVRHALQLGQQRAVLRAAVTNVGDKAYFESLWGDGRVNVAAPRTVRLSVTLDL